MWFMSTCQLYNAFLICMLPESWKDLHLNFLLWKHLFYEIFNFLNKKHSERVSKNPTTLLQ